MAIRRRKTDAIKRGIERPAPRAARRYCVIILDEAMPEDLLKKLKEEIKVLEDELHVKLPRELKAAREHGDLSENAEYQAAKERQRYVDARLAQLKQRLANLSMLNLSKIPHGKVSLGSEVHLLDLQKNEEIVYRLVLSEEADVQRGLISTTSPIGRGLLGKEEGDEVKIQTPNGLKAFEIVRLLTVHDLLGGPASTE
jgi:transcription elongation factor GreA